ncbi:MAG: hypothetical protein OHK0041_02890 [Anaerolineales bacterium]
MKYSELHIQTLRQAPHNARTEGWAFLVRAGYVTRENLPTRLGQIALDHLRAHAAQALTHLAVIGNERETFFPIPSGNIEVIHCPHCQYTERLELARFAKKPAEEEALLPAQKVETPECNTIESLANFLRIPKEKTAKALMYTRVSDGRFVFVAVRGDMQLSEAKLKAQVGDVRLATAEEIIGAGAAAGYASAVGLSPEALIVVDDLIPASRNLAAGANESGWHLINTNYGRDYSAEIVADLAQAKAGDPCALCGSSLEETAAIELTENPLNLLLALAETHHDERGLTLPHPAAPFDVYLMHVPGREMDTHAKAEEVYRALSEAGVSALFDDREERAGVKFNDADLIGCPLRVTVGEKALKEGMVELKPRTSKETRSAPLAGIAEEILSFLK